MDHDDIPTFAQLAADPEIAPLLTFSPVPRQIKRPNGWTPELQRELIARIASTGTLQQAVWQMGKHATGAESLYKNANAAEFRAAWNAAIIIGRRRNGLDSAPPFAGAVPGKTRRRGKFGAVEPEPLPGQVRNEHGEWEAAAAYRRRGDEAAESICGKLLPARRLYLMEIAGDPGKRAAFEILSELAIDWDKAARLEPQPDEPWNPVNQRQPDMILTAQSGWSMGEFGYGPDKMAELRRTVDRVREEQGLPPVDWDAPPPEPEAPLQREALPAPGALDPAQPETPAPDPDDAGDPHGFALNSQQFYDAVCEPRERPWIVNGSLPPEPRSRDPEVIIEPAKRTKRRR